MKDSICYINKVIVKKDDICAELRPDMDCDCVIVRYNGCKEFVFGSYCIAESMAYLVEKRLYQVQERYNQFPYNVCEMICKVEYEEFAQNDIYIIALCEMALLEANSGKFFVNVLRKMKNCNYLPKHINELEYFISTHYDIGFRGSRDSINSLLDVIYPNEIIEFENLKKWIITRYELGCEFREKSKCFIALFLSDNEHKYIYWQQIMDEFGCPNVEDGNGNLSQGAYLAEKSIDIGYMLAPMAISKIVGESTQICPLIDICKNDIRFMCTKKCENSPLKKKEENDSCPIALFARLYGLEK